MCRESDRGDLLDAIEKTNELLHEVLLELRYAREHLPSIPRRVGSILEEIAAPGSILGQVASLTVLDEPTDDVG